MHKDYHVFFSYARLDNDAERGGWVTRFHDALVRHHATTTGRKLETFFDTHEIDAGERWKSRLGQGLRRSRLFIAFTSQNYLASEVCRWEWEQYLMLEHSAARGDDGVIPIYFVPLTDLQAESDDLAQTWAQEITERHMGSYCDIAPWFNRGAEALAELDAAERLNALREVDRKHAEPTTLAERLAAIDLRICRRLDRISLADQVIGNINRSYAHFRGRHAQLRQIHDYLINGPRGQIVATHGLGGMGKSALARQYAVAYADFYAAGGIWEIGCAGKTRLGDALLALGQESVLRDEGVNLSELESNDPDQIARTIFAQLRRMTERRLQHIGETLHSDPQRRTPDASVEGFGTARCLLVLDNVDDHRLLDAAQMRIIPQADWLEILVTTRFDPQALGAAGDKLAAVEVPPLSLPEGLELLRSFMPGGEFPSAEEEQAATAIVRDLGGFTLSLELVGAYLSVEARRGALPSTYLARLQSSGIMATDQLAAKGRIGDRIQHEQKQVSFIVDDTLHALRNEFEREGEPELIELALDALRFASLMQPDSIPFEWLKQLAAERHPDMGAESDDGLSAWPLIRDLLGGLQLLNNARTGSSMQPLADDNQSVRTHRLVSAHIRDTLIREDATQYRNRIDEFLTQLTSKVVADAEQSRYARVIHQYPTILDQVEFLLTSSSDNPSNLILWVAHHVIDWESDFGSQGRAFELAQRVLQARISHHERDPNNAEVARDVSVSQNKLGNFHLQRGQHGDADTARDYYEKSLATRRDLLERNRDSAQAARDVSVSHYNLVGFAKRQQNEPLARHHADECWRILHGFAQAGRPMDPAMQSVYEELQAWLQ